MTVFDDAIFDLTPSDVTVTSGDATRGTNTMETDGIVFSTANVDTYQVINTANMFPYQGSPWTFLPGTDVGTTHNATAYNPPDFYTGVYYYQAILNLGEAHTAEDVDPPTNFLAGWEFGTFDVEEGKNYFVDCEAIGYEAATPQPQTALKVIWLDSSDAEISTDVQRYPSSDLPGSYSNYLYWLTAPTGAVKVTLQMWAIPQNYTDMPAGAGMGIGRFLFFPETSNGYYDDPTVVGYHGNAMNGQPVTSGRRVQSIGGKDVILGVVENEVAIPSPATSDVMTLVAAFAQGSPSYWSTLYAMEAGVWGYSAQMDNSLIGDPAVDVAKMSDVVAVAMTYDDTTRHAKYYDLTGEMVYEQIIGDEYTIRTDVIWINALGGLLRMTAWDRILDEGELSDALFMAAGLESHDITWYASYHDGGSPLTGWVVSEWNGIEATEHKINVPETTAWTTAPGTIAVQVFAVNAIGRSAPAQIIF